MLIPLITEKSVIFIKELSFPQTAPTDDAFFNWSWTGACGGRWAGPGLLVGWAMGCWIARTEVGSLQGWFATGLKVSFLCKNKNERGSARASPVAAPMPKLVPF